MVFLTSRQSYGGGVGARWTRVVVYVCVFYRLVLCAHGFTWMWEDPRSFAAGEAIELNVTTLSSIPTQLPYDPNYSLNLCRPTDGTMIYDQTLSGYYVFNSPYKGSMLKEEYCKVVCQVQWKPTDVDSFQQFIGDQYRHNWLFDRLPAVAIMHSDNDTYTDYSGGFPIGFVKNNEYCVYNHVNIILEYHVTKYEGLQIVGFFVEPLSVQHQVVNNQVTCNTHRGNNSSNQHLSYDDVKANPQKVTTGPVVFSYDVQWRQSNVPFDSRWDTYLSRNQVLPDSVRWLSLLQSILIVLVLGVLVKIVYNQALHGYQPAQNLYGLLRTEDSTHHQAADSTAENTADAPALNAGLKALRADVFRPPTTYPLLFCVLVGSGMQLTLCLSMSILIYAIGAYRPEEPGSILSTLLLFYVFLGWFAGFTAAVWHRKFNGQRKEVCALLTATLFPGLMFIVFYVIDTMCRSEGSEGPFARGPLILMLLVCLTFMLFLVFGGVVTVFPEPGAIDGWIDDTMFPDTNNSVPRPILTQHWYRHPLLSVLIGGLICFIVGAGELQVIMSALWLRRYYCSFGFALLNFVLITVASAQVSVLFTFLSLNGEDYRWWWRSLLTPAASAVYVFVYSIWYFPRLQATHTVTYVLYFLSMAMFSVVVFLVTGTVGFLACYNFNREIYSSIAGDNNGDVEAPGRRRYTEMVNRNRPQLTNGTTANPTAQLPAP